MDRSEWDVVIFTVWVSILSTLAILPVGLALGWALARRSWPGKVVVETLVTLPLVLPPVATGLILLKLFGRRGPIGGWLEKTFGLEIVFTWKAVVVALSVMSFPLLVRTLRVAIEEVNPRLEQVARTLGASPWRVFWQITFPLARRGIAAGVVLAFARALGEFGATIMVAGAIPGKTSTLAVSIFNRIQLGQDGAATQLLLISVALSFGALLVSECLLRKGRK